MHQGREESVLAAQLIGWMYESHCWVDGKDFTHKVCLWCAAISKEDMKIEGTPGREPNMCPKNPLITVPEALGEAIKDTAQLALDKQT